MALMALVFGAGIGSLATEIAASRLLAPYFGSSTIVWANLIGIVLAALAFGYWLGGRLADRRPEPRLLGLIVLAAAVWVALTPFLARPFLDAAVGNLDDASAGAVIGSFFAVLLLFAPAVVALGMVSPFAIRLAITDVATAGAVAGRFYALSTAGSLLGTFVPALIAIPLVGTQRTLLGTAALLALSASFLLGRRVLVVAAALAALVALPPGAVKAEAGLLHEEDSLYQFIQVVERPDGHRLLRLNEGVAVHSVWRQDTVLTGGVWDAFLVLPPLLDRPLRSVAILGNAGGTIARALGKFYPEARVDGVELDPAVSRVGRRWFGMEDNPRLTVYDADARPFLRRTDKRYDLIIVDAYHQPYVPFYLATREFFRLARERLEPGGILALNVASVPGDESLLDGISGTLTHEFDFVAVWPALRFNKILLAFDEKWALRPELVSSGPAALRPLRELLARQIRPMTEKAKRPWTDDRAPVEWVTDRMIVKYAAQRRRARRGSPPDRAMRLLRGDGPLIRVGHRGAAALAPENTLRSFEVALAHGVDAIEFDVLDLIGGPLVLAHSNDLAEVSHGAAVGTVRDRSLAELQELAPQLPTLDEALAFLAERDVALHVDLKLTTRLDELVEALERHGLVERAVVSSFNRESLRAVAARSPTIQIGFTYPEDRYGVSRQRAFQPAIRLGTLALRRAIVARVPSMIERVGAAALMLHHAVVSAASVERAHGVGAAVWAWTVDDPASSPGSTRPESTQSSQTIPDFSRPWLHCPREARTRIYPARGVRAPPECSPRWSSLRRRPRPRTRGRRPARRRRRRPRQRRRPRPQPRRRRRRRFRGRPRSRPASPSAARSWWEACHPLTRPRR